MMIFNNRTNKVILTASLFLLCQCTSSPKNKNTKIQAKKDSIVAQKQKAKFNGEYLKLPPQKAESKKKESRGIGANFYAMGRVKLTLGSSPFEMAIFNREKTVLTFSKRYINTFIKGASGKRIQLHFTGNDLVKNAKGNYKATLAKIPDKSTFSMIIEEKDKVMMLEEGTAEIVQFSPKTATFEVKIKGVLSDSKGKKQKVNGTINLKYESVIKMPDA